MNILDKLGTNIYINNNHYGYLVDFNDIKNIIQNWKRNREPDENRIEEIYEFLKDGGFVPNVIYIGEINDVFYCYDGNHRRCAFNKLNENIQIILDVIFNTDDITLYTNFININKNIQVPELYLEENENKEDILELVKKYEKKYKTFLSTSSRCRIPNFNRDKFVDNLYEIYKEYNMLIDIKEVEAVLEKLNTRYSKLYGNSENISPKIIEKCRKYNFWLFINKEIKIDDFKILMAFHK